MSCYIALDGPDGCGKSSQSQALCEWLRGAGHDVLHVREPGSTPAGEALRNLLLSPATGALQTVTEVLLFSAARAELVHEVIGPALAAGRIVVAERCYLSTLVYQVLAMESPFDAQSFFDLTRKVHGACLPDAIYLLDVPPSVAAARRRSRRADRIEARGADYEAKVRAGFRRATQLEVRAVTIDAAWPFASVQASLRARVARLLEPTAARRRA
ncbi:MAG: dTMP kinase [Planctomycetes bacterium]|nr:dTMP kinase [Planctomycetota bacterium]